VVDLVIDLVVVVDLVIDLVNCIHTLSNHTPDFAAEHLIGVVVMNCFWTSVQGNPNFLSP